ncbi:unnamed protein product [Rangifer tarandus platyrhynchus]|uniref:Uncharacterized protein n=1 Tax=Rangifer tarandus platyrhynchus TaxID=3082113 RepID=A0ABN8XM34_RANTA|nr:unnamed protein product [Rangifer tarandus platyrhynchus]
MARFAQPLVSASVLLDRQQPANGARELRQPMLALSGARRLKVARSAPVIEDDSGSKVLSRGSMRRWRRWEPRMREHYTRRVYENKSPLEPLEPTLFDDSTTAKLDSNAGTAQLLLLLLLLLHLYTCSCCSVYGAAADTESPRNSGLCCRGMLQRLARVMVTCELAKLPVVPGEERYRRQRRKRSGRGRQQRSQNERSRRGENLSP